MLEIVLFQLVHALRILHSACRLDLLSQIDALKLFAVGMRIRVFSLIIVQAVHLVLYYLIFQLTLLDKFLKLIEIIAIVSFKHVEATGPDVCDIYGVFHVHF